MANLGDFVTEKLSFPKELIGKNTTPVSQTPETEEDRRPWPQFNAFRDWLTIELERRIRVYDAGAGGSTISAPFVRFVSCQEDAGFNYNFFTMGLHGFTADDIAHTLFDSVYGNDREIVGYAYDKTTKNKKLIDASQLTLGSLPKSVTDKFDKAQTNKFENVRQTQKNRQESTIGGVLNIPGAGAMPIPGIVEVSISRAGVGQPYQAFVKWRCYNRPQLEFLRQHFMIAGSYVVIEWGQNFSDYRVQKILDYSDKKDPSKPILTTLQDCVLKGRKEVLENWNKPNGGNYDFIVGRIGNFNIQLDAQTGIYECMTTVVSVGENIFGLSPDAYFNKNPDSNNLQPTTYKDYFKEGTGGGFDHLISNFRNKENKGMIADYSADNAKNATTDMSEKNQVNPNDYTFVSWEWFANVMIPDLFGIITKTNLNDRIKDELEQFIKLFPDDSDIDSQDPLTVDWVGFHPKLQSTNPDKMLLVHSNLLASVPDWALAVGQFDGFEASDGNRGHLSKGVWINSQVIRRAFAGSNSFFGALENILGDLNDAVANYWHLHLFFDEDKGYYRIVDDNYGNVKDAKILPFYRFNRGGRSELVGIDLESAYPKELVTQMMLYAKFKSESPLQQEKLLTEFPALGNASSFIYGLNWTALEDILESNIQEKLKSLKTPRIVSNAGDKNENSEDGSTNKNESSKNKILPDEVGRTSANTNTSPVAGQPIDSIPLPTDQSGPTNFTPRNSPLPPAKNTKDIVRDSRFLVPDFKDQLDTLISALRSEGYVVKINETIRSQDRQFDLFDQGRKTSGPQVTWTVDSAHSHGCAADLIITGGNTEFAGKDAGYERMRQIANSDPTTYSSLQFVSKDLSHVERKNYSSYPLLDSDGNEIKGKLNMTTKQYDALLSKSNSSIEARQEATGIITTKEKNDQPVNTSTDDNDPDKKHYEIVLQKFGSSFGPLIAMSRSQMISEITKDGYLSYPERSNSFVVPFPTTTKVRLKLPGISGFSVSDAFLVERLPFIFEMYGCFQVVEFKDVITDSGWYTEVTGIFRLIWLNGEGPPADIGG